MNSRESTTNENRAQEFEVIEFATGDARSRSDQVVIEEPVEIRLVFGPAEQRAMRSVSITMRTPGNDEELAAGFLFTESILTSNQEIAGIVDSHDFVQNNLHNRSEMTIKQVGEYGGGIIS